MCLLVETFRIENGDIQIVEYHEERMNGARWELFGCRDWIAAETFISPPKNGLYKCRALYKREIEKVEYVPYILNRPRSLRIVENNDIDYSYKYADKSEFKTLLSQKGNCDDILIIKHGFVTDISRANIAFFDGKNWLTPDTPLLYGTKRAYLLDCGKIQEATIKRDDIKRFKKAVIFNTMIDLEDKVEIDIDNIIE
jgi:4-amino-4-deoxychorismate lyase